MGVTADDSDVLEGEGVGLASYLHRSPSPLCLADSNAKIIQANDLWSKLFVGRRTLNQCLEAVWSPQRAGYREFARALGFLSLPCRILVDSDRFSSVTLQLLLVPDVADDVDLCILLVLDQSGRSPSIAGLDSSSSISPAGAEPDLRSPLTNREIEIVTLLAKGLNGPKVANQLKIAEATVQAHVRNAMRKTGVSTRTGLVAYAMAEGLVRS